MPIDRKAVNRPRYETRYKFFSSLFLSSCRKAKKPKGIFISRPSKKLFHSITFGTRKPYVLNRQTGLDIYKSNIKQVIVTA